MARTVVKLDESAIRGLASGPAVLDMLKRTYGDPIAARARAAGGAAERRAPGYAGMFTVQTGIRGGKPYVRVTNTHPIANLVELGTRDPDMPKYRILGRAFAAVTG